jgi:signal transduction histidine kinase
VAADAPTIERILYNLVDNACKYASAGADQRVHVVATVDSSGLVLSVRDHGPGIEPSERPRIFRAFVRGSREAAGTIPGLGLGLSLAQGLAREIGAELRLEPAREGARFDLRLPRA